MELLVLQELSQSGPFILLTLVGDDTDCRGPLGELLNPVLDSDEWDNDKEWSFVTLVSDEIGEEGDRLNGLSQSHLVGQDAVQVVVVQ